MTIFPGCRCCSRCNCEPGTRLPYTQTVTFTGLVERSHSVHAPLEFSSTFGGGAAGVLMSPGGCTWQVSDLVNVCVPNRGSITEVLLTNPGGGYAQVGRKQPIFDITSSPGTGATFSPTLKIDNSSGCPVWSITSIGVSGGTGYLDGTAVTIRAVGAHAMPDVKATVSGGSGGVLSVTMSSNADNPETWHVDVTVDTPGSGYTDGELITFVTDDQVGVPAVAKITTGESGSISGVLVIDAGKYWRAIEECRCNTIKAAAGTIHTGTERSQPTVTASVSGVTGATFLVSLASNGDTPQTWGVVSVSVASPGEAEPFPGGFSPVTFSTDDTTVAAATGTATAKYINPGADLYSSGGGTGLAATLSLSEITHSDGLAAWIPSVVSVVSGGSGYSVGDYAEFRPVGFGDGRTEGLANCTVTSVDESGAVVTMEIGFPGVDPFEIFRKFDGVASVTVDSPGSYYRLSGNGAPTGVTVEEHGSYFCTDPKAPPCVASVTVTAGGGGTGAVITPTIDSSSPDSPTWGQVTGLTISDGGQDYLAWDWVCTDDEQYNNKPITLVAVDPVPLTAISFSSCFGECAAASVLNRNPRREPLFKLTAIGWSGNSHYECGTVTYTMGQGEEENGKPYWYFSSISASGGSGYVDNPTLSLVQEGCFVHTITPVAVTLAAVGGVLSGATIQNPGKYYWEGPWDGIPSAIQEISVVSGGGGYAIPAREEPTGLSISASPGTGATFTPTFVRHVNHCGIPTWTLTEIAVSGGSGYQNDTPITFSPSSPIFGIAPGATAVLKTARSAPTVTAEINSANGSGASFGVSVTAMGTTPETWSVSSVSGGGGSGYIQSDSVVFTVTSGSQSSSAHASFTLNQTGGITSVTISDGGVYWRDTDVPQSVSLLNGGEYYKENYALPAYVSPVTVSLTQYEGSYGSGVSLAAVVNSTVGDPQFGQIIGVTVENGGSNYSPFGGPGSCLYAGDCGTHCGVSGGVQLIAHGGRPVEVVLSKMNAPIPRDIHFISSQNVSDCGSLPSPAAVWYGAPSGSVSIAAGGEWTGIGPKCADEVELCPGPNPDPGPPTGSGVCCVNGSCDPTITTQEECEGQNVFGPGSPCQGAGPGIWIPGGTLVNCGRPPQGCDEIPERFCLSGIPEIPMPFPERTTPDGSDNPPFPSAGMASIDFYREPFTVAYNYQGLWSAPPPRGESVVYPEAYITGACGRFLLSGYVDHPIYNPGDIPGGIIIGNRYVSLYAVFPEPSPGDCLPTTIPAKMIIETGYIISPFTTPMEVVNTVTEMDLTLTVSVAPC